MNHGAENHLPLEQSSHLEKKTSRNARGRTENQEKKIGKSQYRFRSEVLYKIDERGESNEINSLSV